MSVADELARVLAKVEDVPRVRTQIARPLRSVVRASAVHAAAGRAARSDAADQAARFHALEDDDLVFVEAVAAVCGCTQPSLYRWIARGTFPAAVGKHHHGNHPRNLWRVGDVRAWIEQRGRSGR